VAQALAKKLGVPESLLVLHRARPFTVADCADFTDPHVKAAVEALRSAESRVGQKRARDSKDDDSQKPRKKRKVDEETDSKTEKQKEPPTEPQSQQTPSGPAVPDEEILVYLPDQQLQVRNDRLQGHPILEPSQPVFQLLRGLSLKEGSLSVVFLFCCFENFLNLFFC
jgi:hypothetical protein